MDEKLGPLSPEDRARLEALVGGFDTDDGSSLELPDPEDVAMVERLVAEDEQRRAVLGPLSPEDEDAVFESLADVLVEGNVVPLRPEPEQSRVVRRRPIRRPEARG